MHFKPSTKSAQIFLWEEASFSTVQIQTIPENCASNNTAENVQKPILTPATKEHVGGKQLGLQLDTTGVMQAQPSANEQIYMDCLK